ncbi:MAG: Tyrosine protein kinase, partial [Massilia sp.]|nr:Tyrosine protein kinase [Massilia sp.]
MTKPADHHQLTHVVHSPPVLSVPFDPRPSFTTADEPTVDL